MELHLKLTEDNHRKLKTHLFPGDGKEAVAVALCGRNLTNNIHTLMVYDIIFVPYKDCTVREPDMLKWSTSSIIKYFEKIAKSNFAILKIHSHPNGYKYFSEQDNKSDREFFDSVFGWSNNDLPHASAIMLPEGKIFGRFFNVDLNTEPVTKVSIVGDLITFFNQPKTTLNDDFARRTIQAFGEKTYTMLNSMEIGIVGASGTGSIVIEQLVRLGVGKLVIADPDIVETKNLNRILNSTRSDAEKKRYKVDVLADAYNNIGLETKIITYRHNIYENKDLLKSLSNCDLIFGCLDSVDGRYLINQLSTFYIIPYFDLGVKLEADNKGGISKICGTVHYIQPGKSSLLTRGVYTLDDVRSSSQYRKNPNEYFHLKKNSYIKNINVNSPAVISINMQISSHAINEFLNRVHQYKVDSPDYYAASTIDMTENFIVNVGENKYSKDLFLAKNIGRGDVIPYLEMPELSI
ncbi:MAG: ThiF family adenylyltransferase [Bacteroidetes bacterium]|nr:ThiF family adenylyltransferase [Bacteroidota bacterium]